ERLRDMLRRRGDALIERAPTHLVIGGLAREEGERADRRAPGAKILGGETLAVAAHSLAQVVVDHAGVDRLALAVGVDILEQLVTGQLLAATNDAREAAIVEHYLLHPTALALEREERATVLQELHVAVAQRRQPIGLVRAR